MRRVVNVIQRDQFVYEAIAFARQRIDSTTAGYSKPRIAILNGAEGVGKELAALAFYAVCIGKDAVPQTWDADILLSPNQKPAVVFHNYTDAIVSEEYFERQIQTLSEKWSFAQFIVLSNLKTKLLNQFRLSGQGQLHSRVDSHVNVTFSRDFVDGDWRRKLVFDS